MYVHTQSCKFQQNSLVVLSICMQLYISTRIINENHIERKVIKLEMLRMCLYVHTQGWVFPICSQL